MMVNPDESRIGKEEPPNEQAKLRLELREEMKVSLKHVLAEAGPILMLDLLADISCQISSPYHFEKRKRGVGYEAGPSADVLEVEGC